MKKYSIGFIVIEMAVLLVISIIPTAFVALYTDPEKNSNEPYVVENVWEKIEIELINVVIANGKE